MSQASDYAGIGTVYLLSGSEELEEDESFVLHGVALGEGDVTIGQSGVKKVWPAEALREAAATLEGQPLVKDHINTTEGNVGTVTQAEYRPGVGVVYEAEIAPHYEDLAKDVEAGLMEVSARVFHAPEDQLEEDESTGALVVEDAYFDNLSVVNRGASPSNTAEPGPIADAVGDMDTVEASATIGGEMATAVLERSVNFDAVNDSPISESEPDDSGQEEMADVEENMAHSEDYSKNSIETDFASIEIEHQSSDGESITVDSAWANIPFYVCSHLEGTDYIHGQSMLSGSIGETGPFNAGEEVEDVTIELEEPLSESTEVFATLHYANPDGEKGSHILAKDGYIQDCATIVVEDSEEMSATTEDTPTDPEEEVATDDEETEEDAEEDNNEDSDDAGDEEGTVDELDVRVHEPQFEETTTNDVSDLDLEDWGFEDDDWDELDEVAQEVVAEHFLASESGFPPESFDDLTLPVVTADGELSEPALRDALDEQDVLGDDVAGDVEEIVSELLDEFDSVEENADYRGEQYSVAIVQPATGTDQFAALSIADSSNMINYEEISTEELGDGVDLDGKVLVDQSELESLSEQAEKADKVEDELGQLSEKLDDQSEAQEIVAELSEEDIEMIESEDDTAVVEAELAEMVEDVTSIYAEELEKYSPFSAEELADRWSPLDLKAKIDDHDEAELSATIEETEPEPEGGSASEEELSQTEEDVEEEELREQYAANLEDQGWERQAEKIRAGELDPFGDE